MVGRFCFGSLFAFLQRACRLYGPLSLFDWGPVAFLILPLQEHAEVESSAVLLFASLPARDFCFWYRNATTRPPCGAHANAAVGVSRRATDE